MGEALTLAAVLLVAGTIIGAVSASTPAIVPVWSAPREERLRIVGAHRLAWTLLNAGFILATVTTAAGLAVLAFALEGDATRSAALAAVAVAYLLAGGLWCAVLAIRAGTTPSLADLVARGSPTEPAETLLGAATGALFTAFTLITSVVLVVLGLILGVAGGVALPVAVFASLLSAGVVVAHLRTGDSVPAVLYLPTLLIGLALLLGWT